MSEIKKLLRCYKCGDLLQDVDPSKSGYILPDVYNSHTSEILLCNKCFEKTIFNNQPKMSDFGDDLYVFLEDAQAADALVVLVLDLFSFEGCTNKKFIKAIGSCNIVVVANKLDLLPKNIDLTHLTEYVSHHLREAGLNVQDVFLCSATNNFDDYIPEFKNIVNEKRKRHDVYLIGFPNSGKTTLANAYLKNFTNTTNRVIQTIKYSGTNTRVIEIPLDRTSAMYDVPGFFTNNSVWDIVEKSVANDIAPNKVLEGRKINLVQGSAFSFGGLTRIDLLSPKRTSVTVYCSNKIDLHYYFRGHDLDKSFYSAISRKSLKPISTYLDSYEKFDIYDIEVTEDGERDIGILGLGWISFTGEHQIFRVTVPKNVYVYSSMAKIIYVKK